MKNKIIKGRLGSVNIAIELPSDPKEGLSKRSSLCEKCGMLFDFKGKKPVITMKDTSFPLDIIFLDKDLNIVDTQIGEALDKNPIQSNNSTAVYVLEVNYGFTNKMKIYQGDSLKIESPLKEVEKKKEEIKEPKTLLVKEEAKKGTKLKVLKLDMGDGVYSRTHLNPVATGYDPSDRKYAYTTKTSFTYTGKDPKREAQNKKLQKAEEGAKLSEKFKRGKQIIDNILKVSTSENKTMYLLDEDGKPQMPMKGGERIFSRVHTRELLDLVKNSKDVKGLIALGKKMVEIIKKQDTQKPEYVTD